jgi:hypothetical protein
MEGTSYILWGFSSITEFKGTLFFNDSRGYYFENKSSIKQKLG